MSKPVTYAQLSHSLKQLGFRDESVEDSHMLFRHSPSDTMILFGRRSPKEPVRLYDAVYVGRMLDERGLVDRKTCDEFFAGNMAAAESSHLAG